FREQQWRIGRQSLLDGCHHRQRLIVEFDGLKGVLGKVATAGDYQRHWLADVAHHLRGSRWASPCFGLAAWPQHRQRRYQRLDLGAGHGCHYSGHCPGCRKLDPRDPRVWVWTAQDGHMHSARQTYVVNVAAPAAEKPGVFGALERAFAT